MTLEDFRLRVFVTLAEQESFTGTAKALHISQPAVSQHIAELERMVGEPLFTRARGRVGLTDKGRLFKTYAGRILYWYGRADAVLVRKTEAPAAPTLLDIDADRRAEISVEDGRVCIKLI